MKIELNKTFRPNSKVDEFDTRQIKKALNRLGYYTPYEKTGITGMADRTVFDALKKFQRDHGLTATGAAQPDDETIASLNAQISKEPEGTYIWRSVEDNKVRSSHAAYNRTERAWSDSPDPGEDFNCRCWAESQNSLGLTQTVTSTIQDNARPWGNVEFIWHFYFGFGKSTELSEMGLLGAVIQQAQRLMFDRVKSQIADKAKTIGSGTFSGSWNNSYEFRDLVYALGKVTISGHFSGTVSRKNNILAINATAEYEFYDEFTDPLSVRQLVLGTSKVATLPPSLLGGAVLLTTDLMGHPFVTTGQWTTKIAGTISLSEK
ncbi:peptidoglycan-binding protein [Micavibrio aeruginosavorus]|uniref:Peptidoglycan binding-like domain-containing protein n=1 Tax=Micavibrio aeruginosavorus EPB TaxID=349215 RepID=M4VXC3_9BACT|nr:peptidoglycan-binding protein [Micavibrio aeruginosavorus]AGH97844.1 hypothetical protein A11S_1026 [Micavibrio aeruginosavorus EPB]